MLVLCGAVLPHLSPSIHHLPSRHQLLCALPFTPPLPLIPPHQVRQQAHPRRSHLCHRVRHGGGQQEGPVPRVGQGPALRRVARLLQDARRQDGALRQPVRGGWVGGWVWVCAGVCGCAYAPPCQGGQAGSQAPGVTSCLFPHSLSHPRTGAGRLWPTRSSWRCPPSARWAQTASPARPPSKASRGAPVSRRCSAPAGSGFTGKGRAGVWAGAGSWAFGTCWVWGVGVDERIPLGLVEATDPVWCNSQM